MEFFKQKLTEAYENPFDDKYFTSINISDFQRQISFTYNDGNSQISYSTGVTQGQADFFSGYFSGVYFGGPDSGLPELNFDSANGGYGIKEFFSYAKNNQVIGLLPNEEPNFTMSYVVEQSI